MICGMFFDRSKVIILFFFARILKNRRVKFYENERFQKQNFREFFNSKSFLTQILNISFYKIIQIP